MLQVGVKLSGAISEILWISTWFSGCWRRDALGSSDKSWLSLYYTILLSWIRTSQTARKVFRILLRS